MTDAVARGRTLPAGDQPLPLSLCLGFGVGTVGVSIMLNTVTTYFPALMATVLGQSTAVAGLLLTLSKLYDVIADFVIGAMSDRSRSRWGRRRPFLAVGAIVSAASFLMIFLSPALNDRALIAYMALALVIYSTGYSLFNVPYITIPSEITDEPYQRTKLMSFRTLFVAVGQMLALGGAAAVIKLGGEGASGYRLLGMVGATIIIAAMLGSVFGTAGVRWKEAPPREPVAFGAQVRMLWDNRPLVWLMTAKVLQFVSLASTVSTNLLFKLNVLKIGYEGQLWYAVASNLTTALSMPMWLKLSRRYGKKACYVGATISFALGSLVWLLTGPNIPLPVLLAIGAYQGVGAGGMLLMGIAMLPDVMAYDHRRTGLRREGIFASIYAAVEKLAFAIGAVLVGWIVARGGYIPTTGGKLIEQPASAVWWLYFTNTALPALLLVGSLLAISRYRLDERRID